MIITVKGVRAGINPAPTRTGGVTILKIFKIRVRIFCPRKT